MPEKHKEHGSPQQLRSDVVKAAVALVLDQWDITAGSIRMGYTTKQSAFTQIHDAVCILQGWLPTGERPKDV